MEPGNTRSSTACACTFTHATCSKPIFIIHRDWNKLREGDILPPLAVRLGGPDYARLNPLVLPPLPQPTQNRKHCILLSLQVDRILTFSEFGEDWIAPEKTYLPVNGRDWHGSLQSIRTLTLEELLRHHSLLQRQV